MAQKAQTSHKVSLSGTISLKQPKPKEVIKITVGWVLSWIFGVLFGLSGLAFLVEGQHMVALLELLSAFILLPPMNKYVKDEFNLELSRGLKIAVIVVLFLIASTMFHTLPATSSTIPPISMPANPSSTPTQIPMQTAPPTINAAIFIQDVGKATMGTYVLSPSLQITNRGPSDLTGLALDITLLKDGQIVKKDVDVLYMSGSYNFIRSVSAGDSVIGTLNYMSPIDLNGRYTLKIDLRKGSSITVIATDSKDFDVP